MEILSNGKEISLNHFKLFEFDSPDVVGSGKYMSFDLLQKLDILREYCKQPLIVNSGFRTKTYNASIHGAQFSAHMTGEAVDIECNNSFLRYKIIYWCIMAGISRLEIGSNWMHIDVSKVLPQKVVFLK